MKFRNEEKNVSEYLSSLLTLHFEGIVTFTYIQLLTCFNLYHVSSFLHLYVHEWLKAAPDQSTSLAVNLLRKILVNSMFQSTLLVSWHHSYSEYIDIFEKKRFLKMWFCTTAVSFCQLQILLYADYDVLHSGQPSGYSVGHYIQ